MPCTARLSLTEESRLRMRAALDRLDRALVAGTVTVTISPAGALAFKGWRAEDREGLADVCAYRRLLAANSPGLRRAIMRAEALAGRKVSAAAVASGLHSHDGGATWGSD